MFILTSDVARVGMILSVCIVVGTCIGGGGGPEGAAIWLETTTDWVDEASEILSSGRLLLTAGMGMM